MKRNIFNLTFMLLIIVFFSACSPTNKVNNNEGSTNGAKNNNEVEQEDVTLIWATENQGRYEDAKEAIEEEFPHITIEFYNMQSSRESIQEMLAGQVFPDIFDTYNAYKLPLYMEAQLTYNMDELVDKHGFDLGRIEPGIISRIRSYALNQELYVFPYDPDLLALFYNKDIFDIFGVEYPTDGMTWDEVIKLGRRLTQTHEGTNYKGLEIWDPFFAGEAFDINYVDPDTDEAIFASSEGLRKGLELFREFRQIPGNEDPPWIVHGETAMSARFKDIRPLLEAEEEFGLNWDMVSWPVFEDNPDILPVQGGAVIGIASTSEHKDVAFKALAYLLSDEHQKIHAGKGLSTPLTDPDIQSYMFKDEPKMADKNTEAFFYYSYNGGPERRSIYDNILYEEFRGELVEEVANGSRSIPEILREFEERSQAAIKDQKGMIEN